MSAGSVSNLPNITCVPDQDTVLNIELVMDSSKAPIAIYLDNAKQYVNKNARSKDRITRAVFERDLLSALLKSSLKTNYKLSLIYAVSIEPSP